MDATTDILSDALLSNTSKNTYTWKELHAIESKRRQVLSRSELPYWKILTYVEGTCLKALSSHWLFWFTIATFVVIRLQAWTSGMLPDFARDLGRMSIDVIGGFLSFFLVMYVNQANARFQDMFKESKNACKRIYDVSATVATAFPKANAQRIIRYINAAHAVGYVGLGDVYTRRNFFQNLNETYQWLTPEEVDWITQTADMDSGPEAFYQCVEWCMNDVHLAYEAKLIEAKDFVNLREKIMAFRASLDTIYDYADQPIHFFYIHFLILLSTLYLPLFAASNAYKAGAGDDMHWSGDLLAGLIVVLQSVFVIGLRMLGRKLVNPYGDDLEDLSVLRYVQSAWERSQLILNTRFPGQVQPELEEKLLAQRLGK